MQTRGGFFWPPPPPRFNQFLEFHVSLLTYCKRLRNILEIPMLSEVNKVFKDNPNFVSSLLYFVLMHSPFILSPSLINFQNPWSPPVYIWPPPFSMNLRVV